MTPFSLKIVTPDGLKFQGQAEELIVRTADGDLGILAGHANCVAPLGMGRAVIRVDGKVEAVTLGEYSCPISKEAVLVHVEKANPEIRGLYQAINKEFCRHLPDHVIYVNREEDMGMENLRQTKLSYKPVRLAEKYSAVWKQGI